MSHVLLNDVLPRAGRLIVRHILGLQPDPGTWPPPRDTGCLPVPDGIDLGSSLGPAWVLDREFMPAWHRRRTAIGAQAYRFARNNELDCGWRLADVAARFLRQHDPAPWDIVSIVPPPPVYGSGAVLPWISKRLVGILDIRYEPNLFAAVCPFSAHPDTAAQLPVPTTELFHLVTAAQTQVAGRSVLLLDWRRHRGRTLATLARLLREHGADVTRFTWLN